MADGFQSGSAYVTVRPNFTGWHQAVRKQLQGTTSDFSKAGAEAGKAFSEAAHKAAGKVRVGVEFADTEARAKITALKAQLDELGRKSPTVRARVDTSSATQSISSLALAGLSLGPALLPVLVAATGAAIGFGVALAAAAAGAGAIALVAVPGISRIKAALTAQKTAATQAVGGYSSSLDQIKSAEEQLTVAQQNAKYAQQALSAARIQARKDAVDLANSVIDAELAQRSAVLSVAEARQALVEQNQQTIAAEQAYAQAKRNVATAEASAQKVLADPKATAAQKAAARAALAAARQQLQQAKDNARDQELAQRRARLAVKEAIQQLKEQRIETKRLQQQEAQERKTGIAGDKNVIAARRALAQADRQVADAERALAQARQGTSAASAKSAAATAKLTGPEQRLLTTWKQLTAVYDRWAMSLERPVFNVLTNGLKLAERLLPTLTPFVRGSARAFGELEREAGRALTGPTWQSFARTLARLSPVAILRLGRAFGNVATGVAGLAKRAAPFTVGLLKSVDRLTARFSAWGTGRGASGFTRFLDLARKDAAPVGKLLGSLVAALPTILHGIAPLAPVSLAFATALAKLVAATPPKVITAFAIAFVAWKVAVKANAIAVELWAAKTKIALIATKAWTAAQWLFNAAQEASPIGLVITAIGALVIAIIYIATKTKWFQKLWSWIWNGPIGGAIKDVWNWIKQHWPLLVGILTLGIAPAIIWLVKNWGKVETAAKEAWNAIVKAVKWAVGQIRRFAADIWDVISWVFGKILHGAAVAFGWIPGIGGKLRAADKAFQRWAKSVDRSIRGIKGHTVDITYHLGDFVKRGGGVGHPVPGGGGVSALAGGKTSAASAGSGGVGVKQHLAAVKPFAAKLKGDIESSLSSFVPVGGGGGDTGTHGASAAAAQRIARALLPVFGFGPEQMGPLLALWNQESGWRWNATNPTSGAYGIPQSLPASKMATAGADWRTNPATQEMWGLGYIKGRYGSPAGAWAHEQAFNWYDTGGMLPPGYSTVLNATGKPEPVLTSAQWDAISAAAMGGDGGSHHDHFYLGDVGGTVEARVRGAVAAAHVAQRRSLRTGRRR